MLDDIKLEEEIKKAVNKIATKSFIADCSAMLIAMNNVLQKHGKTINDIAGEVILFDNNYFYDGERIFDNNVKRREITGEISNSWTPPADYDKWSLEQKRLWVGAFDECA